MTKMYEIEMPPNCAPIFFVKNGKVYHDQDVTNPYPWDAECPKYIWTGKTIIPGDEIRRIIKYTLPLFSFSTAEMADEFVKASYPEFDKNKSDKKTNLIVVWRRYSDRIIIGAGEFEAIADTRYTGKFCRSKTMY